MDPRELPGVASLEVHRSLPSTSDRAKEWIREGIEPVAVVVAAEQTRGRGRGGRPWISPAGSGLWMSVVLPGREPGWNRLLPLRVGMALAEAIDALPERRETAPIRLKWPNDVFVGGGKAGGILCESLGDHVVVGVGLNCVVPDVPSPYPVAALEGLDPAILLPVVTRAVLAAAEEETRELRRPELRRWQRRDLLAGTEVEAEGGVTGQARGVDAAGRLLISDAAGRVRSVTSGSVRPLASRTS